MPKVSVIIPAWNLWDMTASCLRSLAEHTPGEEMEVLVVDNGSHDGTAEHLPVLGRNFFGENFREIRLPQNMGFAVACNAGARAATGNLLFFLNNDTVVGPNWLPPLIETMNSPGIGATGPLLLYPDGSVQHCGIAVSPFRGLCHIYEHFPGTHALPRKQRLLQAITGAALMLRKEDFFRAGAFFEDYLNGFEDVDLCCALRHMGLRLVLNPQSVVVHHTSRTPGRFDADKHNAELLTRRRRAEIQPDLHLLAARDGYRLCAGRTLTCWLSLPETREESLDAELEARQKAPDFDMAMLEHLLTEEPLWLGGHLRRIDMLEAAGRRRKALAAALSALDFFPLPQIQTRLTRLARREGMRNELAPLLNRLAEEANSETKAFRPAVRAVRREARNGNDAVLTRIMDDWLTLYG
ncbi:MAG: glycosyltransferase family 2 protein [Desulfovibrio sp.]|jgi:GT2 family glycosyltransferase|nr:glycosyltransferase family 2 protein [Desulfovibrio sp.]